MIYTIPDYYGEFKCTADQCEDTCCAGWQIAIDERSLQRYHMIKGDYKNKVKESIDWKNGVFRQDGQKRCAFLKENNLCDMYINLGADGLCKTCRLYPRHIEEFEGVREISLSLSCPEVAKLLLGKKNKVRFRKFQKSGEEEFEEFDPFLYSMLVDVRKTMFRILHNRELSIETRMTLCLGLAYDIEKRVKENRLFECEELCQDYNTETVFQVAEKKTEKLFGDSKYRFHFSKKMIRNLWELEFLNENWEQQLVETEWYLYSGGEKAFVKRMDAFIEWIKNNEEIDWPVISEQLMVYYLYTYFCGAVYDERIFVNAQMAIACVDVIWTMIAAKWLKNEKQLDMEDIIEVVYRFSRELEHSEDNLKTMWDMLGKQRKLFR